MVGALSLLASEAPPLVKVLQEKYPYTIYQDVIVNQDLLISGTQICEARYQMIRPILDTFQKPFKVLEIGAAQGFFSFSLLRDYPLTSSVMIENNTSFYPHHG